MILSHDDDHRDCGLQRRIGHCGGRRSRELFHTKLVVHEHDQVTLPDGVRKPERFRRTVSNMMEHSPEGEHREPESAARARIGLERPAHRTRLEQIPARELSLDQIGVLPHRPVFLECGGVAQHLGAPSTGAAQAAQRDRIVRKDLEASTHVTCLLQPTEALPSGIEKGPTAVVQIALADHHAAACGQRVERSLGLESGEIDRPEGTHRSGDGLGKKHRRHLVSGRGAPPTFGKARGAAVCGTAHNENLHADPCAMLDVMNMRVIAAAAAIVCAAGCTTAEQTVEPISAKDLAASISERLESELNAPFAINCPEALAAEVGASVTCEVTSLGASQDDVLAVATVTSVDTETGHVEFDITAAPATTPDATDEASDEATDDATDDASEDEATQDS